MTDAFLSMHPIWQAFFATLFTWGMTALGAAAVYLQQTPSRKTLDIMLGFAAGVMIAASFWSLLAPALEMAEGQFLPAWLVVAFGFMCGGGFLRLIDKFLPHLHLNTPMADAEGIETNWRRSTLLVLAITMHNIPEGLAVGVAFGAVGAGFPEASMAGAMALAMGIGIQNFPEGLAVAVPLRRDGLSRHRSFMAGQLSGMVEVIAGVAGAAMVAYARPILPFALAFAAGAMIFVVVEEVIPESQQGNNTDLATFGVMSGFSIMMMLDVALG
ncbi:ZIP family metal transporter [Pelobacter seleniigenes]|uniref:ZIP family metal transporter n=1 Tax=Pelobacter seleniigenes TaxID=407188 RepID=UPI0004A7413B|nr:ZIP family metal transporter [Pelobacter seleniigenes]